MLAGNKYAMKDLEQKLTGQLNDLVAMVRDKLDGITRKKVGAQPQNANRSAMQAGGQAGRLLQLCPACCSLGFLTAVVWVAECFHLLNLISFFLGVQRGVCR